MRLYALPVLPGAASTPYCRTGAAWLCSCSPSASLQGTARLHAHLSLPLRPHTPLPHWLQTLSPTAGSTVSTKHGNVNTDYILFICSGAFHSCKPSDMLAELQVGGQRGAAQMVGRLLSSCLAWHLGSPQLEQWVL